MPLDSIRIKWGYAAERVPNLPQTWAEARDRARLDDAPPRRNDVIIAEIGGIGRHTRIDLAKGARSAFFEGDLVGCVFSPRYATRQFEAIVPQDLEVLHFLCAGGICGRVVGLPDHMKQPTLLKPVGYLLDDRGERVNIRDHALRPIDVNGQRPLTIVVVGAAMDSGKTTAAFSLVNGLTRAGIRTAATKITGTGSARDIRALCDAGAVEILDFTSAGFGSTCGLARRDMFDVTETLLSNLTTTNPEVIVVEIADGMTQRETAMLLERFAAAGDADGFIYTCNDALGVKSGIDILNAHGLPVLAVSGAITASPLGVREVQQETELPVITRRGLMSPETAQQLVTRCRAHRNASGIVVKPSLAVAAADEKQSA